MANDEHLKLLKQGVKAWNEWRVKHPEILPDLRMTNLSHADLSEADLTEADLANANLNASFFDNGNLTSANLTGANLVSAELVGANLSNAVLQNADFTVALTGLTLFVNTDLSLAKGLDSIGYTGPSEISISTIFRSGGNIPESFLRGCGLKDWEIENTKLYRHDLSAGRISEILYKVHELRTNPAIQFNSCFISYSTTDQTFAEKLYKELQDKGVRCWFAPEHMKIGDKIRNRIDEARRLQDRLLLVLSESSIESQWVEQEVETALEKEREEKRTVLCPIMVDKSVMNTNAAWASFIKNTRHIGDFSRWDDEHAYQKAFDRLLRDLKAESSVSEA
jgi:hypothetical protein